MVDVLVGTIEMRNDCGSEGEKVSESRLRHDGGMEHRR